MVNTHNYDAFCFDLDGTIYVEDTLLPGVREVIHNLRAQHKKVLFISNTSINSRENCKDRLEKIGIQSSIDEIITTNYLAARYFKQYLSKAKVFIVGEQSLIEEFMNLSIRLTSNPLEATHVLVGLDRDFTYQKLNLAMQAVRNGAEIVVTNSDIVCPVLDGYIADTFVLAKAIEIASERKINTILGKPSSYYSNAIMDLLNIPSERCLIVGDRLETDIKLGLNSGMKTCLVLTGVTKRIDIEQTKIYPDYILENLSEFRFA
ncbi:HAD-IIA family hydrolase [Butyricicoccus sp. 1XD8-22]|nr:HAD-IIA family hydrolase [Butyricicoccus sp. 1XD8-22]